MKKDIVITTTVSVDIPDQAEPAPDPTPIHQVKIEAYDLIVSLFLGTANFKDMGYENMADALDDILHTSQRKINSLS